MPEKYVPPGRLQAAFHCPHCGVYAHQRWFTNAWANSSSGASPLQIKPLYVSRCSHCTELSLWWNDRMIVPASGTAPLPNPDLPAEIVVDYTEAREIVTKSPRGAAALLRLSIQKLCQHLGQPGKNINDDIGALVRNGLPVSVQQALDTVRVIGNNAVHPGQIDLKDDEATAASLFELTNFIAEKLISEPKRIAEIYGNLPPVARDAIAKRDGSGATP